MFYEFTGHEIIVNLYGNSGNKKSPEVSFLEIRLYTGVWIFQIFLSINFNCNFTELFFCGRAKSLQETVNQSTVLLNVESFVNKTSASKNKHLDMIIPDWFKPNTIKIAIHQFYSMSDVQQ